MFSISKRDDIFVLQKKDLDWENTTVLFTGASPELESEVDEIFKKRENLFLISSDTSSFFLIKSGIIPDAVLSVDPGRGTAYHFREDFPDSIPIITWMGGNTELFRKPNPIFLVFTTYPLDQLMLSFLRIIKMIPNPGLNISTLALSIAENFGVRDFGFAGINFHSMDGKTHCRGTGYELFRISQVDRMHTMEGYLPGYYKTLSKKNLHTLNVIRRSTYGFRRISDLSIKEKSNSKLIVKKIKAPELPINEFLHALEKKEIQLEIAKNLGMQTHHFELYIQTMKSHLNNIEKRF